MHVYVVEYGSIDFEDEGLCSIWTNKESAVQAAIQTVEQILEDASLKDTHYYEVEEQEHCTLVMIKRNDDQKGLGEIEWWRISEKEVQE